MGGWLDTWKVGDDGSQVDGQEPASRGVGGRRGGCREKWATKNPLMPQLEKRRFAAATAGTPGPWQCCQATLPEQSRDWRNKTVWRQKRWRQTMFTNLNHVTQPNVKTTLSKHRALRRTSLQAVGTTREWFTTIIYFPSASWAKLALYSYLLSLFPLLHTRLFLKKKKLFCYNKGRPLSHRENFSS